LKTIELRSLLTGTKREITISNDIEKFFNCWKEKRAGENLEPLEIFYAGYILANPSVRDLFKKNKGELKN
jgi:hypothetical protein